MDVAGTLTFSGGGINVDAKGASGAAADNNARARQAVRTPLIAPGLRHRRYASLQRQQGRGWLDRNYMYDGTATLASGSGYPDGTNADASQPARAGITPVAVGPMAIPVPTIKTAAVAAAAMVAQAGGGNTWSNNLSLGGFGGAVFPYAAGRLAMGGGGGSGSPQQFDGVQSSGGQGGGLIIVRANSITGTANLSANGGVGVTGIMTAAVAAVRAAAYWCLPEPAY